MRALAAMLITFLAAGPLAAQDFTTLKGHGGPVMGLAVHPETGQVATSSFDNSVGLWSERTPRWLEGHEAAVVVVQFIDETRAISGGDDFDIILWSLEDGTQRRFEGHKGKVAALDVSPDKTQIVSASWDGSVGVWPLDGSEPRFLTGHQSGVSDVVFSVDGQRIYTSSADGTIRVWRLSEPDGVPRIIVNQGFGVNKLILAPDESWLAYGAVDGVTRIVDPENGETLRDFSLDRRPILSMAYHEDTQALAAGDGLGYIMMIDTSTWEISRDFRAMRNGPVWALDFSPDGTLIYAGGIEDVAFAWPVAFLDEFDPAGGEVRSFLKDPEEMSNGERQFMRKCSICHALTPPPSRKAGPTLFEVFGRRAGTVEGYPYSDTLDGSDIIWSDETIDALFDIGPDHYIPGSKMPMQRITGEQDRKDLVAFLKAASNGAGSEEDKREN
ncbi:c-type cytochrome [Roseovarius rhodophyticola]|uniref:C-type cytochrome n=1 Tax=Roseovarius rhodophyticola TaxID=3080827 RepID=A0ABZ2TBN3_9RHOB|nr:c-type cytochrome [Roseovarius sp. W115]MDV2930788.1 c-type cytochrome [Roseovarius sp. W115]